MENRDYHYFVADFETTSLKQYLQEDHVRVYDWGMKHLYKPIKLFAREFLSTKKIYEWDHDDLSKLKLKKLITQNYDYIHYKDVLISLTIDSYWELVNNIEYDSIIYFHNGSGFDFYFLLDFFVKNKIEYEYIIDVTGKIYQLEVINSKNKHIKFNCSWLLLFSSVKKMGHDLKLNILKGEIDYSTVRNYKNIFELPFNEIQYLVNDILIVSEVLKLFFKVKEPKLTIASTVYNEWKEHISKKFFVGINPFVLEKMLIPSLDKELFVDLRRWYSGGLTYLNPKYKNKLIKRVSTIDVNSLYPSVMMNYRMPYGKSINFVKKMENDDYYFKLYEIDFDWFHVKEGYIPFINLKERKNGKSKSYDHERVVCDEKSLKEGKCKIYLSHWELPLFEKSYNGTWRKKVAHCFRTRDDLFKSFLNKYNKLKNDNDGSFLRNIYKLFMNSVYGKFAQHFLRIEKRVSGLDKFGTVQFQNAESESKLTKYLPIGIAITAAARTELVKALQGNRERFIYCDTDSIHIKGELSDFIGIDFDEKTIGKWKFEGTAQEAVFKRTKRYALKNIELNGKIDPLKLKCAGLSKKTGVDFETFKTSNIIKDGKLTRIRVNGGVLLLEKDFTFKEEVAEDILKRRLKDRKSLVKQIKACEHNIISDSVLGKMELGALQAYYLDLIGDSNDEE